MLADISIPSQAGAIGRDILLPATARYELIDFIAAELPAGATTPTDIPLQPKRRLRANSAII